MCRLILFISKKSKCLHDILIKPKNSLWQQSINPNRKRLNKRDHLINVDGFGIGFLQEQFVVYKNPIPPYHDKNILELSKHLKSNLILGHIRAVKCSKKSLISYENCHPFYDDGFLMMHNGLIKDFTLKKQELLKMINNKYFLKIKGQTDSELIFYLFLSFLESHHPKDIIKSFNKTLSYLRDIYKSVISANIVISNKDYSIVSRFINSNEEPPSLYYQINSEEIKVSSEPIDDTEWNLLEKNKFLFINHQNLKISVNDYL